MRTARVLAVASACVVVVGWIASPALAHSKLTSTVPADGAILDAPPPSVSFAFDENLLPGTDTISINDDRGNVVATEQVTPDGPTISMPWPAAASAGVFQAAYRVVSGDGHPVTGAISITITGTAAPAAVPTDSATVTVETTDDQPKGIAAALVVIIALAVLVLIVAAGITIWRRRPGR